MGLVNTLKSLNFGQQVKASSEPEDMPLKNVPQDPQPDGIEEDEDDRAGNDDPGTNQPPVIEPDEGENSTGAETDIKAQPIRVTSLKYTSIGANAGQLHITGTDWRGQPFSVTEAADNNATLAQIGKHVFSLLHKFDAPL